MKIRTLVVDDEPLSRSNLTVPLRLDPDVEIVGECGNGVEALAAIRASQPDLVFLDVEMPECDGFDVLEMLGADLPPAIVLVTAYDKYALQAFEAGALDYLLKPFENNRFDRALERGKKRIVEHLSVPRGNERLVVKTARGVTFLNVRDIDWIEAADYYSRLHVGPKTYLLRRSLSELERELGRAGFCRIHRSTIVAIDRVRGLEPSENGEYDIRLSDETRVRSSRRYRTHLMATLGVRPIS